MNDEQKRKGRTVLIMFQIFNSISFNLMSGNIITLYALKIGANTYFIGLINSFISFSLFMMIIGKMLEPKFGLLNIFRGFWTLRYISMIPSVFAAFIAPYNITAALLILGIGVFFFAVSRGIGYTGFTPMVASVSSDKKRGGFFSLIQLIFHIFGLIVSILIIFFLGKKAPITAYVLFISTGIVFGIIASFTLFFFPDKDFKRSGKKEKLIKSFYNAIHDLASNFKIAFKRSNFSKFVIINSLAFFLFNMIDPFIIVFFKKVYKQPDNIIAFFIFIGTIGAVLTAYLSKQYIDRIGAKVTIFIFSALYIFTLFLLMLSPSFSGYLLLVYAGVIFFTGKICITGMFTSSIVYVYSIIKEKERLNLSIIQQISCGASGFLGANVGGIILQTLESYSSLSIKSIFIYYFLLLILFISILGFLITKLDNAGGYSVKSFFKRLLMIEK